MKKEMSKKRFSTIVIIIFSVLIPVVNSSCKKGTPATPPGSTIIYTDVNPDSVIIASNSYSLDMNKDGIYDFTFSISHTIGRCALCCSPHYNNTVRVSLGGINAIINTATTAGAALALDSNAVINSSAHWSDVSVKFIYDVQSCSCGTTYVAGFFPPSVFKYLAVRFVKGTDTYYGWVKLAALDIYGMGALSVSEYAYNSSPNQPILAGQK